LREIDSVSVIISDFLHNYLDKAFLVVQKSHNTSVSPHRF
jgi:hypothetical protein